MKRCPACGGDYIDDSMSFCFDDGSELLFGPASTDERSVWLIWPGIEPAFDPVRTEPNFQDTTRRIGPQEQKAG